MKRYVVALCFILAILAGHLILVTAAGDRANGGAPGVPSQNGDVNGSGLIDLSDAVYLLQWLFLGGPDPIAIAGSPELEARVETLESAVRALQGALPAGGEFRAMAELLDPNDPPREPPFGALREVPASRSPSVTFSVDGREIGAVLGFTADEGMSRISRHLVALRFPGGLDAGQSIGKKAELRFQRGGIVASWSGVVDRARASVDAQGRAVYVLSVTSSVARLGRLAGYRIYQGDTVPKIVGEVLEGAGLPPPGGKTPGDHPPREYCVQYNETQLQFVSRLLEEEGIFYYFESTGEGDKMILGDSPAQYAKAPESAISYYGDRVTPPASGEESIWTFELAARAFTGAAAVRSYDPESDKVRLSGASVPGGEGEVSEYVPGLRSDAEAGRLAALRVGELQASRHESGGTSNDPDLRPGHLIQILDAAGAGFGGEYLVTSVRHTFTHSETPPGGLLYGNQFTCIPATESYRPQRRTPPPAAGVDAAVVVGPPGEEIETDKLGRVKVRFHWDQDRDKSTAWVRVATPSAGKDRGFLATPEVGDEVIVGFEGGDPNRPYVLGALYNGGTLPPVELPRRAGTVVIEAPRLDLIVPRIDVSGVIASSQDATSPAIVPGERWRDNGLVAWARVEANAEVPLSLGVKEARQARIGRYQIALDLAGVTTDQLIACVTPLVAGPAMGPSGLRVAAVIPLNAGGFEVFIHDGFGQGVSNAFNLMVTAR